MSPIILCTYRKLLNNLGALAALKPLTFENRTMTVAESFLLPPLLLLQRLN